MASVQFSSVAQSCPTLCDPMNLSTPGLPVHHQLPEFTQTHVHQVRDAIQPSYPLSSPFLVSPITPSIRVFSSESTLRMRWPMAWGRVIYNRFIAIILWKPRWLRTAWSWKSSTSCKELTHWKRLWCWEGLRAGGEGDDRGWDGWMASLTQWTWVLVNSGSWWWAGGLACCDSWGHKESDMTERLNWTELMADDTQ